MNSSGYFRSRFLTHTNIHTYIAFFQVLFGLICIWLSWQDHSSTDLALSHENGILSKVDPQPPSADLLGDLLAPLAIEGPPGDTVQSEHNSVSGLEGGPDAVDGSAIVAIEEQTNTVQVMASHIVMFTHGQISSSKFKNESRTLMWFIFNNKASCL